MTEHQPSAATRLGVTRGENHGLGLNGHWRLHAGARAGRCRLGSDSLFRAPREGFELAIWLLIVLAFPLVGAFIWLSWGQDSVARRPRS
ncbi:PLDc_N domain-containing protein [Cryobacterium serini]|uniref:PLDc_N domain-containing protein n=1 Tax=Cryobacterium serini TaxID=1259201 RepID=A0A4R9BRA1_9MICO|nr:PLDc_N domain-containing protein [Cryobacterium serini]